MHNRQDILSKIKAVVTGVEPGATVILYGSYARGEEKEDSDIDLLVLLDKSEITLEQDRKIRYPLYDIEFETGRIISPLILSEDEWKYKHSRSPFYENVKTEGVSL